MEGADPVMAASMPSCPESSASTSLRSQTCRLGKVTANRRSLLHQTHIQDSILARHESTMSLKGICVEDRAAGDEQREQGVVV